jgi:hypothetical protein
MAFTLNRRLAQLVDSNGQLNTGKIPNGEITVAMLDSGFDTDGVSEGSTNLYFTNARIDSHLSGGTGVTYSSGEISIGQDVSTSATPTFGNITTTGYLAGPATFTIDPAAVGDNTGTVVIAGNLQVDGTTTTINSTTMEVDDLNITLASGAANAAAANGAGITVDGASATITYDSTNDEWDFNKDINVTGTITFDGGTTSANLNFGDNDKAVFGAGSDLQIYHDGSNSYIKDAGTGSLILEGTTSTQIKGSTFVILRSTAGENMAIGNANGSFDLYYDAVKKLATTSTGIDVTGTVTADGLTVSATSDALITIADSTLPSIQKFDLKHNAGASSLISGNNGAYGTFALQAYNGTSTINRLNIGSGGDISFYEDTGTTAKFFWDASAESLGIGTDNPQEKLQINGNLRMFSAGYPLIDIGITTSNYFRFVHDNPNDIFKIGKNGAATLNIGGSGNVGIGTDSPTQKLDVAGTALVENAKLKAIAESNADTAVDVFVYDTRKDSDGGAWRKRTQNTSWYNETLNTSTRGARKEFPCVAVIVVEAAQVTIYDGDDPDMPMWMVFNGLNAGSSYTWHGSGYSGEDNTCASMKNGVLCIGVSGNVGTVSGLSTVSFIDEFFIKYGGAPGDIQRPIVFRNSNFIVNYQGSIYDIVGDNISDVTMTVLPNAPINSDTGLPVPTIAISMNGGVSVIKDNGSIVDITSANGWVFSGFLTFDEENYIIAHVGNATGQGLVFRYPIPAGNITVSSGDSNLIAGGNIYNGNFSPTLGNSLGQLNKIAADESGVSLNGKNNGTSNLVKYYRNYDVYSKSSVAYINSAYNTGWMQGDIRLATLSSTSTVDNTDYVGGAGTFANAGDWSTDSQWSVSGGTASYSGSGVAYISRTPTSNFVGGNWYYAELDVTSGNAGTLLLVNRHQSGVLKPHTNGLTNVDVGFIQLSGTKYFAMWKQNANNQGSISLYATAAVTVDNFKVYEMPAHDRSVNNNHFIKYGTINSSAVETGAELISYSTTGSIGNGNSDYLFQPYTADLDFGTGDLSTIIWYRQDSSLSDWSQMFQRGGEQYLTLRTHPSSNATYNGKILFKVGSASWAITDYNTIGQGWICIVLTRQSGITRMYVNGNLEYTTATHTGTVNSGEGLSINPGGGKVALLRMSATVPSQEQIKKIYNDEKHLFAENAKATLYGSSDDIAALAYDVDTELLHVGTSAGRSVFQGLNRVDNTTDAVGTAISASSELVVEE